MPRWARCAGRIDSRSRSSKAIVPALGRTMPEIVLNSVVLPAPFGPTIATNWPSSTLIETPFKTGMAEYPAVSPSMRSMGHPFFAEIGLDDTAVPRHRFRFALDDHGAMVEHQETVDQPDHRLHRMFDDRDRHAVAGEPLNHFHNLIGFIVPEARERFVEQQDARLACQRAGELHQPQFLGGEFAGDPVGDTGQADAGDRVRRQLL